LKQREKKWRKKRFQKHNRGSRGIQNIGLKQKKGEIESKIPARGGVSKR